MKKINNQNLFYWFFILLSAAVFVIVAIRCATVPFCNDESATFFHFIQPDSFLPYHSYVTANNHVLNSCLSWMCFKLFGSSIFSLRLPNLLALFVLILAVYRISKQLTYMHSKMILTACFLLSFRWLSFYSVCRGYGISMAFLILSISYLVGYFNSKELKKLFLFYLFIQIAISANLILVIVAIILTFSIILFQLSEKQFLKRKNIIVLLAHVVLIIYWVEFSFFLQSNSMLYIGWGGGYWNTTFVSLIQLLSGIQSNWIPFFILLGFIILVSATAIINLNKIKTKIQNLFITSLFYPLAFYGMIAAFYGMKIFFHINYPEERTGLFFYVFFVLSVVFMLDRLTGKAIKVIAGIIVSCALIHFILNVNFSKHASGYYITFPERFYTRLMDEQKQRPERITIGGEWETKFVYAFWNYRHNEVLDTINASFYNKVTTNFDYIIAWDKEELYYKPYYDKIDSDKSWGLALFKCRKKSK